MKHKHCELIKAWADGAEIECHVEDLDIWIFTEEPSWNLELKYRIRLEPKPDIVRYFYLHSEHSFANTTTVHNTNVKVVFDGESCKIKSAEVLNG